MAVYHAPETAYAKLLWPWDHTTAESHPADASIKGVRPIHYQPYPAAMYRPKRDDMGVLCFDFETAGDEVVRAALESQGYVYGGKGVAKAVLEVRELEYATLAANRAATDRKMSLAAQAEAAAVDDATDQHVPVIPEARQRGKGER